MSEKKVLIFGTGQFAQIIKRYLEEQGRVLAGFTVNKSRGRWFDGEAGRYVD